MTRGARIVEGVAWWALGTAAACAGWAFVAVENVKDAIRNKLEGVRIELEI